jgi:hypothetical protein
MYSVALLLRVAFFASAARAAAEPCTPPPHFVAVDIPGLRDAPGFMQVSLPSAQFSIENLVCLVRTLKQEHFSEQGLTIFIFDSRYAADEFVPTDYELSPAILRNNRLMRAMYMFNPSAHKEDVRLTPFGYHSESVFDTRIDLGVDAPQPCRVTLDNRCLLVFDALDVERLPPLENASGSVVLKGRIGPDGQLGHLRVASVGAKSAAVWKRFSALSIASLRTWWFEPAPRGTDVQITVHLGVGMSQTVRNTAALVMDVSNFLTITATVGK